MKNPLIAALASIAVVAAIASAPPAWPQRPVALVVVDVRAVGLGYRASQLLHRPVTNDKGQEIGRIDDLIVGRDRVLFAIISVGGFLGIGGRLIAVPYSSLTVSPQHVVLPGASRQAVGKLPAFQYR
jgi:sporulation protein YlmC with PRC-barrel domain